MNKTIIYTGAFRFPNGDAAAPRVINNAKILRDLGYNILFISFGGNYRDEDKDNFGQYFFQGFQYIISCDIDIKQTNILKRIQQFVFSGRKAIKFINSIISDAEFVIGYQPSAYFTNKMLNICKQNNSQFISDLTEWYNPNEFPGGIFAPPSWLNEWNMRVTQKRVKNKIVISSFLNKFYKTSHNFILPPLVDHEEEKWNYNNQVLPFFDGIRIIYTGTPAKKDLLESIVNSVLFCLKQGLKIQLVIVGVSIKDIYQYKRINEIISFKNNILLCGRIPQEMVPCYLRSSDFSIIIRKPNRKSMAGFPTKFAESLASGCPVITNRTSDILSYIEDRVNGIIVENYNISDIINSITEVSNYSKSKLNEMKLKAFDTAKKCFDFRVKKNEMEYFIQNIIKE